MGPDWQQQLQRQQQLLREQMERMRKQQGSWREQQQKGYAWRQQPKNNQHNFGAPKSGRNKVKGYSTPLQVNQNLVQTPIKKHVKKGGFTQVVSLVVALGFIVLAIYGVLWLLSTL